MMDLCEVINAEGRVVGGDELELVGGLNQQGSCYARLKTKLRS